MKIAHYVLSSTFAGIEQHVQELTDIQGRDNEIVVICNQSISHHYTNIEVKVVENISRRSIFGILSLILVLRNIRPDIVHSHGSKTTSIINSVRRFIKLRHVASVHGIKSKTKVYNKANRVIAGSQKIQDSLKTDSSLVENWWHPSLPENINNTAEYVLAIGRLEPVKGFDLLIESWVNVNKKLLIVGDGPEKKRLEEEEILQIALQIASALDKPFKIPELVRTPSPTVAIPVSSGSASRVSTTTRTGKPMALAKSKSRWS